MLKVIYIKGKMVNLGFFMVCTFEFGFLDGLYIGSMRVYLSFVHYLVGSESSIDVYTCGMSFMQ